MKENIFMCPVKLDQISQKHEKRKKYMDSHLWPVQVYLMSTII